jgi:hypothetical protein
MVITITIGALHGLARAATIAPHAQICEMGGNETFW